MPEDSTVNRCVLFDLDGTLYDSPEYSQRLEQEIARYVAENISVTEERAKSILREQRKRLGTLTMTLESLGIDRNSFFEAMAGRINPGELLSEDATVRTVIRRLKEEGFKVGLVSNSGRVLVEKILKALQLELPLFDVIVTSSEARPKPSPEPFLLAMRLMNCEPDGTIYVGDRDEAELRPARELGIRTILLDRAGSGSAHWADAVVTTLSEVPTVTTRILSK